MPVTLQLPLSGPSSPLKVFLSHAFFSFAFVHIATHSYLAIIAPFRAGCSIAPSPCYRGEAGFPVGWYQFSISMY